MAECTSDHGNNRTNIYHGTNDTIFHVCLPKCLGCSNHGNMHHFPVEVHRCFNLPSSTLPVALPVWFYQTAFKGSIFLVWNHPKISMSCCISSYKADLPELTATQLIILFLSTFWSSIPSLTKYIWPHKEQEKTKGLGTCISFLYTWAAASRFKKRCQHAHILSILACPYRDRAQSAWTECYQGMCNILVYYIMHLLQLPIF